MSFELEINSQTKLCNELSSRHYQSTWKLVDLRNHARQRGLSISGKNKAALCELIYKDELWRRKRKRERERDDNATYPDLMDHPRCDVQRSTNGVNGKQIKLDSEFRKIEPQHENMKNSQNTPITTNVHHNAVTNDTTNKKNTPVAARSALTKCLSTLANNNESREAFIANAEAEATAILDSAAIVHDRQRKNKDSRSSKLRKT